jgi:hypothetical protein
MEININKMCNWERKKSIYLMEIAENKLNMDLSEYGFCDVNQSNGNVYIWLENYPFSIYLPINCELTESDVIVLYTDNNHGDETELTLDNFDDIDDIYKWIEKIEDKNYN